jgi:hypothetical protein
MILSKMQTLSECRRRMFCRYVRRSADQTMWKSLLVSPRWMPPKFEHAALAALLKASPAASRPRWQTSGKNRDRRPVPVFAAPARRDGGRRRSSRLSSPHGPCRKMRVTTADRIASAQSRCSVETLQDLIGFVLPNFRVWVRSAKLAKRRRRRPKSKLHNLNVSSVVRYYLKLHINCELDWCGLSLIGAAFISSCRRPVWHGDLCDRF